MQCYAVNTINLRFINLFFEKKVEQDFKNWTFLKMSNNKIDKIVYLGGTLK